MKDCRLQIAGMGLDELLMLRAAVEERLLMMDLGGDKKVSGGDMSPKCNGASKRHRRGERWVELKMINGCGPYAYERWWDGKIKRSRYLGKVRGGNGEGKQ